MKLKGGTITINNKTIDIGEIEISFKDNNEFEDIDFNPREISGEFENIEWGRHIFVNKTVQ